MFDTIVVLISWSLWLERNARTFNNAARTVEHCSITLRRRQLFGSGPNLLL
ncbi:hypothetical protein HU200_025086 [Digitaria exilis]|uniref:Uncharacterized protein n=1 Tax=Digitaria exilis TaxID=1010633 RepID=A0A835C3F6_9POAL|nr:hypothetical protein HU200_025086 [Digitaria exilis]